MQLHLESTQMNQLLRCGVLGSKNLPKKKDSARQSRGSDGRRLHYERLESRMVLATIHVHPVVDGFTLDLGRNGTVDIIVTDQSDLQTVNLSAVNKESRSELEFDLSNVVIDPSEMIESVRLEFLTLDVLGSPEVTAYGYIGDGIISSSDHHETQSQIGFEQILPFLATSMELSRSFVEGFVGSSDALGILLTTSLDSAVMSVSSESITASHRPVLVLETSLISVHSIEQLANSVKGLELPHGIENGMLKELDGAIKKLEDHNPDNDEAAIGKLEEFLIKVEKQRGVRLTDVQADSLATTATDIIMDIKLDIGMETLGEELLDLLASN